MEYMFYVYMGVWGAMLSQDWGGGDTYCSQIGSGCVWHLYPALYSLSGNYWLHWGVGKSSTPPSVHMKP